MVSEVPRGKVTSEGSAGSDGGADAVLMRGTHEQLGCQTLSAGATVGVGDWVADDPLSSIGATVSDGP